MAEEYKYFAFISYNKKDTKWGFRLHDKLENYRMPSTLCSEKGWKRKPIRPVFFAPTDIQPSGLDEELKKRLRDSKHLIVICSPNSAQSEWVGKEIEYFYSLGRPDNIHLFIVDGIPNSGNSETECFNPMLQELEMPELLGANIHEQYSRWPCINKERAYVQLITKLLGVEFDSIWQRHKRQLIQKVVLSTLGVLSVLVSLISVWFMNQSFDAKIRLTEATLENKQLPPLKDAIVTIKYGDEVKQDTVNTIADTSTFLYIPHKYLNQNVKLTVSCDGWLTIDTIIKLKEQNAIALSRDVKFYGEIKATLYSQSQSCTLPNQDLYIGSIPCKSDNNGVIHLIIPLKQQSVAYKLSSESLTFEIDSIYGHRGEADYILVK